MTTDEKVREVFKEMLAGDENNPVGKWVWNVPWKMVYDKNSQEKDCKYAHATAS